MSDSSVEDFNKDGIPDRLQTFLNESDFRSDWSNRRKVIFSSLIGLGVLFCLQVLAVIYLLLRGLTVDLNLAGLVSTILWVVATIFMAVIGAYVSGVQVDVNNFRSSITDIVSKVSPTRKA